MSAKGTPKGRSKKTSRRRPASAAPPPPLPLGAAFALATAGGVGVFLSYPNFVGVELFGLQWVSLAATLWAAQGRGLRATVAWWGYTGFVTNLGGFYWLEFMFREFGHLSAPVAAVLTAVMAAYQGLVFAAAGGLAHVFARRAGAPVWVALPVGFVIAETLIPLIFPWYLANGQFRFLWMAQMVDLGGVALLSAFIAFTNAALFDLAHAMRRDRPRARRLAAALATSWAISLAYGAWRVAQIDAASAEAPKVRVGMIEADVGIWEKEAKGIPDDLRGPTLLYNLVKHHRLSAEATAQGAELVVWPESSYVPLGEVAVKRSDLFAVAVAERGGLLEWRDDRWVPPVGGLPPGIAATALRTVLVAGERELWAGGDGGLLLRHDGRTWTRQDAPDVDVVALAARAERDERWLAGADGRVYRRAADRWELFARLPGAPRALAFDPVGRTPWALTATGEVLVPRGERWEPAAKLPAGPWRAMHIAEGGVAALGGRGGRVALRTLRGWSTATVDGLGEVQAVFAVSGSLAYAAGARGWATWDGERWRALPSPLDGPLRGVAATEDGRVALVGADGRLASRETDGDPWQVLALPDVGPFTAVAASGFYRSAGIPADVAWFYRSRAPLPDGADAAAVYEAERGVPWRDRTALLRGFEATLIFGAVLREQPRGEEGRIYNSALMVDPRGKVLGRYDKNYLLMFGEYIPFGETFPVLYEWLPEASHFTAGTTVEAFDWGEHRLGVMVCYEDILPRFTRRLADKGTHALVNITNDAWFGQTAEPYLHLALAVARTIENRQWMVRATNTGVSAFIDAAGRLVAESQLTEPEVLVADVPLLERTTPYQRVGDAFTYAVFAFGLVLGARAARARG